MSSILLILCSQEAAFRGRACRIVWLAMVSLAQKNGTEQSFLSHKGQHATGAPITADAETLHWKWVPSQVVSRVPGSGPHRGVKPWEEVRDAGRIHGPGCRWMVSCALFPLREGAGQSCQLTIGNSALSWACDRGLLTRIETYALKF